MQIEAFVFLLQLKDDQRRTLLSIVENDANFGAISPFTDGIIQQIIVDRIAIQPEMKKKELLDALKKTLRNRGGFRQSIIMPKSLVNYFRDKKATA